MYVNRNPNGGVLLEGNIVQPIHSELHPKIAGVPEGSMLAASTVVSTALAVGGIVLLDSEEAAALIKIHPKTLQKMARLGEVVAIHVGKLWRFRRSALNRWLEKIAG